MVEAIQENAIAANFWLIGVMALFHLSVMGLLGLAIWRTLSYRSPLHEEFLGAMPHDHDRHEPEPLVAPETTVIEVERDKPV